MFDGVGWAASEIVGFMILATLVGFAIGWIFGRWLQRSFIVAAYDAELVAQEDLARKAEYRLIESNHTLDKLQDQLRSESEKVGELESQLRVAEEAIVDLETALAAVGGSDEAFSKMRHARDEARADVADLRGRVARYASTLEDRDLTIRHMQTQLTAAERSAVDLEGRLVAAERRAGVIPELQSDLERKNAEYLRMSERLGELETELESSRGRVGKLEAELAVAQETAAVVPGIRADLDQAVAGRDELLDTVADLEARLETTRARADQLDAELAAIPKPPPTKDEAIARMAEIARRTGGNGPVPDDDLKRIHGIGPKLEQTLKGLGITSFRQVANLQPDDIAIVTAATGAFKGRIERDDWMSSASEELLKLDNEPA